MKYREKLLKLIIEGSVQEFQQWLISQPALDQPAIMRELKQLGELPPEEGGGNILDTVEAFKTYDSVMDKYEDAILDEKLVKQQVIMAEEELTKHVQQMRQTHPNLREYVIASIVNNEANAGLMRSLAKRIIALEKIENSYNPENWKQLPEL